MNLQANIERYFSQQGDPYCEDSFQAFDELKAALNEGRVRAAEPDPSLPTGWKVNAWVKKGILLGFRIGKIVEMPLPGAAVSSLPQSGIVGQDTGATEIAGHRAALLQNQFRDKHTYPLKRIPPDQNIRVVPGGSSIRDGCYIGKNVTCMPPMYVNVGAYVDDGTMIDSHALVIIEDDVLVGGSCGVYEGTIVGKGAVLAAGTILTGSTPVYDLVRDAVYRREGDKPLIIPPGAVVVPGARAVSKGRGKELGLSLYTPVIIKYRDEKTDQAVRLEELLR
jgi:2,3,4,5-tetrahydropyridine-2-carboxylate N-succinyltransferase